MYGLYTKQKKDYLDLDMVLVDGNVKFVDNPMLNYTIYFDGYSSPHKHNRAGWAILIEKNGKYLASYIHDLDPLSTNNETELHGLINALRHALALKQASYSINFRTCVITNPTPIRIDFMGDSQLAIDLLMGKKHTKIKKLAVLSRYARMLRNRLGSKYEHRVMWIPRKSNKAGMLIEKGRKNGNI